MTGRSGPARGRLARAGLLVVPLIAAACARRETPPAGRAPHEVAIRGFAFEPSSLVVAVGDSVVWRNADIVPHTVTAADLAWDSESLATGGVWGRRFTVARTDSYSCRFHPVMKARVEVR